MLHSVTATGHQVNLAFYPVPFCIGLPRDAQLGSSPGFEPASPRPPHQSAPSNHTLSSLCGKGHIYIYIYIYIYILLAIHQEIVVNVVESCGVFHISFIMAT